MKTLKLSLVIAMVVVFLGIASSTQAYFRQAQSYPNYSYNPYQYGYQDHVSSLVQSHLNFVSNFTYYPSPIQQYFYNIFSPFSYYGYTGYNSFWGW